MSAFAKVVQGQMSKTSAEEFERLGLGSAKHIKGSSESQLSGMKGRDLFMTNPYEWVQQILVPAMAAKGVTSQNDIIAQVSKLFPVRTAGQVISEMALQGRAFEGAASPFEKDIKLQKLPTGMPAYDELIKNDYPMVIQAFNQQWKNLLETLGSPMMAPGGSVITSMAALTSMMGSIAQFAGENSDRIKGFAGFIKELVSSGVSMLTFLANISNIGAVFELFGKIPWGTITTGLETVRSALASLAEWITNLAGMISGGAKGLFAPKSLDNSTKDFSDALKQQQSFRFDPGTSKTKVTPISLSLNVDGRTLAQTMSEQLEYLHEHATSAPSYDGSRKFIPADGGMMGT
jgi:hypothetical protein